MAIIYKRKGIKMKSPPTPLLKAILELQKIEDKIMEKKQRKAFKEQAEKIDKLYE